MAHVWSGRLLKQNARRALRGRYGRCLAASLPPVLFGGGGAAAFAPVCLLCAVPALGGLWRSVSPVWHGFDRHPQLTAVLACAALLALFAGVLRCLLDGAWGAPALAAVTALIYLAPNYFDERILPLFAFAAAFVLLLALFWRLFLALPLQVGVARYYLENRRGLAGAPPLRWALGHGYAPALAGQLLCRIKVAFGSIAVVPGVYWAYCYRLVPWLLAQNPRLGARRAMALSRAMMKGEKWRVFLMDLSFLPWALLCLPTLGAGLLFLEPWYQATQAELFALLRAKALARGLAAPWELCAYAPAPFARAEK